MNRLLTAIAATAFLATVLAPGAEAKKGAPHSFSVVPSYSSVELSWKAPQAPKQLLRHNNKDYDGDAGRVTSTQRPATIYIAADFAAAELTPGDVITSLDYFEYRPVAALTALIWEDGVLVREQKGDLAGFKANQWRTVAFDSPYTIPAGKDIRIGFRIEHGSNLDFVAIMDNAPDPRGDLRSYDGKTWEHNGRGTYLITANLANDVDEAPSGYSVYSGSALVADNLQGTSLRIDNQPDGTRQYRVEAEYGSERFAVSKEATTMAAANYLPTPGFLSGNADENCVATLSWRAPLLRGSDNLLTWHDSAVGLGNSIGGTASSNTKVWVKNEFTPTDIVSFDGASITGIQAQFHEKTASSIIAWVMVDGVIAQYDTVPQSAIDAIAIDQWVTFPLSKPVKIQAGHSYAYGYYMMHTPKTHPVSVDKGTAVGAKSNSFSTSSPNSSDFAKSKPSWKTLAAGNIPGSWMLAAQLDAGTPYAAKVTAYNVYRDGQPVKQNLAALEYSEQINAPGTYTYTVEAVGDNGKVSEPLPVKVTVKVPREYRAPLIGASEFKPESGSLSFSWDMDVEISHHGEAAYKAGFDEEMTLNWGARFTAAELAPYAGYSIRKLNFIIGQEIPTGFKLQIHNGAGTELSSTSIGAGEVQALGYYTLTLSEPVAITGQEDLILSYSATLPGGCSAMVVDEGPLATGGAVVRLAGAPNWMNLGTINSTYNKYNIVISAVASENSAPGAPGRTVGIGHAGMAPRVPAIGIPASALREGYGIETPAPLLPPAAAAPAAAPVKPERFNVYRNGELIATTTERSYSETLPGYDNFLYQVSAIYNNVWESALSEGLAVTNNIRQASPAPYDLRVVNEFSLEWKAPQASPVLTYCTADPTSYGVGMTGGTTRTTYAVQKFAADSIAAHAGDLVSHIRFGLYSTNLTYASVVVIKDFNIIYEQEIPLADLKKVQEGWNEIRLNAPVSLEAGHDYMFGYHIEYPTGEKPMLFDAGPAVDNMGNLMSASASHTSWKSLKSLNKSLDGNWRIYTTLMRPDAITTRQASRGAEGLTYNVYRNGTLILQGLTATQATPEWVEGTNLFTVTAVREGVESAHSNVAGHDHSGVGSTEASAALYYDAATATIVTDAAGILFDAAGRAVMRIPASDTAIGRLASGTYIFRTADGRTLKLVR